MSKFLINLIIRFGKSESVRKGLLLMLKSAAEKSDNDVDDAIVKMIEEKLFILIYNNINNIENN